jgi:hypothetical protein
LTTDHANYFFPAFSGLTPRLPLVSPPPPTMSIIFT